MRMSYAQGGEDCAVLLILQAIGIDPARIRYLDIGAGHPVEGSNTYLFYTMGARGVTYDPSPEVGPLHLEIRPEDRWFYGGGVTAKDERSAPFFLHATDRNQNSFVRPDTTAADTRWVNVPVVNINEVLGCDFHDKPPDFVSIDAEGMDLDILKAWDFERWRPPVMCVETAAFGSTYQDYTIQAYLETACGYELRGGGFYNGIFVDAERLHAPDAD